MAVVVKPTDWKAESPIYYQLGVGNDAYTVHNAGSGYSYDKNATYSLTSQDGNKLRFEVRPGDNNWFDKGSGSERSEIESREYFSHGTAFQVSYKFTLEPGAANTAKWFTIGQLQEEAVPGSVGRSPEVSIELIGEKMRVVTRGGGEEGTTSTKVVYLDTQDIQRGHEYSFKIMGVIDPDGTSRLVVVRDGVAIVDYEGKFGYTDRVSTHWKEGIYRAPSKEVAVATYSDLEINYGDMVKLPPKGAGVVSQASAPTIAQGQAGGVAGDTAYTTLTGKAVAGQKVTIYDGEKAVASGVAKADGSYSIELTGLGAGTHKLTATTTNGAGALSKVSAELVIEVGTGAEILGRMDYITAKSGLGAVYVTDGNTLTVSSLAHMKSLISDNAHVLDKIDGGHDFDFWSGTSNNRTHWTYDRTGTLIESDTSLLSNGVLTRKTYQYYGADDAIAKEVYQYGVTGKAWVSTYQAFDQTGKMTISTRSHADGTLDYSSRVASDGTTTTENYDAVGNLTGRAVLRADGSKATESLTAAGIRTMLYEQSSSGVSSTKNYDASGVILNASTVNPDKSSELLIYTKGVLTSKTVNHGPNDPDGIGREVFAFNVQNQSYTASRQVYSTDNKLKETVRTHADGTLDYVSRVNDDGSTLTEKYDAAGVIVSQTLVLTDKTTDQRTFTNGILTKETITYPAGSNPQVTKLVYEHNIADKDYGSKLTVYNNFNKVASTESFADAVAKTPLSALFPTGPVIAPTLDLYQAVKASAKFVQVAGAGDVVSGRIDAAVPNTKFHDGVLDAMLTGTASANATVKIYDGSTLIGTAKANALGQFSFVAAKLGAGGHSLTAKTTDAFGNVSEASNELVLAVMTAADFVAKINVLAGTPNLAGVWLSDTSALTIPAGRLGTIVEKYGKALESLQSAYTFQVWSGPADKRVLSTYDKAGLLTETHTYGYKNGVLVNEVLTHAAGTAEFAKEVHQYGITGKAWTSTYQTYDKDGVQIVSSRKYADGSLENRSVRDADGTLTTEGFDTGGKLKIKAVAKADGSSVTETYAADKLVLRTEKAADGSQHSSTYEGGILKYETLTHAGASVGQVAREVLEHNVQGKSFVSSHSTFDASGNLLSTERYNADKSLSYAFLKEADGDTVTSLYDDKGALLQKTVINADPNAGFGAREVFNFAATGKDHVTQHFAYDSAGRLILSGQENDAGTYDIAVKATKVTVLSTQADEVFTSFRQDKFVFAHDFGNDRIVGFNAGKGVDHDTLMFQKGMFANNDMLGSAVQSGNDVVFTAGNHDTLTLANVQKADLHAVDFLLV